MKFLVKFKDGHMEVLPSSEFLGEDSFPLKFQYIYDGYYLIKASKEYEECLGKKLLSINDYSLEDLERVFSEIIPIENKLSLQYYLPSKMVEPVLWDFLNLKRANTLECVFEDAKINVKVEKYDVELVSLFKKDEKIYWGEYMEDTSTYYFVYNSCEEIEGYNISRVVEDLERLKFKNIIIDLRNNTGGDSDVLKPLIDFLEREKENLRVFVFVGIDTYPSGIINLMEIMEIGGSISIGEIPHGCPSHFGETKKIILPNSKLEIQISTKEFLFDGYEIGDVFLPEHNVQRRISDYVKNTDPFMGVFKIY